MSGEACQEQTNIALAPAIYVARYTNFIVRPLL